MSGKRHKKGLWLDPRAKLFLILMCVLSSMFCLLYTSMDYMSQLTGKTKEELAGELQGVIFRVPGQLEKDGTPHYVTADEYLSGNVRRKLRQAQRAAQQDPVYAVNVEALSAAQPKDLDASEIEVRLGATWIDKEYIQQFMYCLLYTSAFGRQYRPSKGACGCSL